MITANDKFIQPEDLLNYDVAPPSPLDPSSVALVMGNDVATESEENEAQEANNFEREEEDFEVVDQQEEGEQNLFDSFLATYCNSSKDVQ